MSSKRRIRRQQCEGKRRHASSEAASKEVRRLMREANPGEFLNAYRCAFCGFWHVGHIHSKVSSDFAGIRGRRI